MKTRKETSYGIIPFRKENGIWEALLVHHNSGNWWGFPKGHAEEGETPRQTAERELFEETNLTVERYLSDKTFSEHYTFTLDGMTIEKTTCFFAALVTGSACPQLEEVRELKWFPLQKALHAPTFPEGKMVMQEALGELINKNF